MEPSLEDNRDGSLEENGMNGSSLPRHHAANRWSLWHFFSDFIYTIAAYFRPQITKSSTSEESTPREPPDVAEIHTAIRSHDFELIQSLVHQVPLARRRSLLNARDENGLSSLDIVANIPKANRKKTMPFLVDNGADDFASTEEMPASLSSRWGAIETDLLNLIRFRASPSALKDFFRKKARYLSAGAFRPYFFKDRQNPTSTTTNSLLMWAANYGHQSAYELILSKCTFEDVMWKNNRGANVMQLLAKRGLVELADKTLNKIPQWDQQQDFINNQNNNGWTPLHASMEKRRFEFSLWLMELGASPNVGMNRSNWTPVHAMAKAKGGITRQDVAWLKKYLFNWNSEASHRIYGENVSVMEIVSSETIKIRNKQQDEALITAAVNDGLKPLVVFTNFYEFDVESVARKGGIFDNKVLDTFNRYVDCETILAQNLSSWSLADLVFEVQNKMKHFDLLFWFVSSHGGIDESGQYFNSKDLKRVYLNDDLVRKFSVGECPSMVSKASVFFVSTCRVSTPMGVAQQRKRTPNRPYPQGNCLIAHATMEEAYAMRSGKKGTLAINAFCEAMSQPGGAAKSVADILSETNERLQKNMCTIDPNGMGPTPALQELSLDRSRAKHFDKMYLKLK